MALLTRIAQSVAGGIVGVLLAMGAAAQNAELEAKVKAAFLFNFAKFATWPGLQSDEALEVCVADDAEMSRVLADTVRGKEIDGRMVATREVSAGDEVSGCEILYLGGPGDGRDELSAARGRPILTVGHDDGFLAAGGAINFVLRENRMRFQVNRSAVAESGLALSSKLLSLAEIYDGGP